MDPEKTLYAIEDLKYKSYVLLTWTCTRYTTVNFLKTYSVDLEYKYSKKIPKNILTRHLSDITDVVLDPEKLANDLHSAGLITFHIKNRVLTTSSYPHYEKVSMLLNDVWRLLRGDEDYEKVMIFCGVLKRQNDEITQDVSEICVFM